MELAIRTAMTRLGAGLLEDLLALDAGYGGPAVDCGAGHQARFVSDRDKVIDTVLGPVTVCRAYYHCGQCPGGVVPRDAELGTVHASLVAGAALDGRPRRDRGPVRQGRRPAGRAGRGQPDRQAGGTVR